MASRFRRWRHLEKWEKGLFFALLTMMAVTVTILVAAIGRL